MSKSLRLAALAALALVPATVGLAAEADHGGGMPQLRFSDPMLIAQVVWLLIIFGLLYFLMSSYALPRVASVLEARRARIDGDLDAARAAKERADTAMADHRAATAKARAEAQAAVSSAVNQAQDEAAAKADVVNARLAQQIEAADRQISAARDAAMGALRQVATDTAEALVTRLTGRSDRAMVENAVAQELATRGRA